MADTAAPKPSVSSVAVSDEAEKFNKPKTSPVDPDFDPKAHEEERAKLEELFETRRRQMDDEAHDRLQKHLAETNRIADERTKQAFAAEEDTKRARKLVESGNIRPAGADKK